MGEDVKRFVESVPFKELAQALQAVSAKSPALSQVVAKMRAGKGTKQDWALAGSASWADTQLELGVSESEILEVMFDLFEKAAENQSKARAVFAVQTLLSAAETSKELKQSGEADVSAVTAPQTSTSTSGTVPGSSVSKEEAEKKAAQELRTKSLLARIEAKKEQLLAAILPKELIQTTLSRGSKAQTSRNATLSSNQVDALITVKDTLNYKVEDLVPYLAPVKSSPEANQLQKLWLGALQVLRESSQTSIDTKLWSYYAEAMFESAYASKEERKNFKFSERVRSSIKAQVALADEASAKQDLQSSGSVAGLSRKAVIPGAGSLLAEVGEFEEARKLLLKEVKNTSTPWYVESSLASVESMAGNKAEALNWKRKAALSAQGNSTKLQWQAAYLMELGGNFSQDQGTVSQSQATDKAKQQSAEQAKNQVSKWQAEFKKGLTDYYTLAFEAADGFSGRNVGRQKKLAKVTLELKDTAFNSQIVEKFADKCSGVGQEKESSSVLLKETFEKARLQCAAHFAIFSQVAAKSPDKKQ